MLWLLFALLAAIADALYYFFVKRFLKNVDMYVLSIGAFFVVFLALFSISMVRGLPIVRNDFYFALFMTGTLNVIAAILYMKALKAVDLSLAIPMISFTPIFLVFTSYFLLGETPSLMGVAGILLIVIGSFVLNASRSAQGILGPLKQFTRNKGVMFMLVVALLWSVTSIYDKIVIVSSNVYFGLAMANLYCAVGLLVVYLVMKNRVSQKSLHSFDKATLLRILALGLIGVSAAILAGTALTLQIVPYVISVKRTSIIFAVLLGGLLLKEKNMKARLAGSAIMVAGVALIAFSS